MPRAEEFIPLSMQDMTLSNEIWTVTMNFAVLHCLNRPNLIANEMALASFALACPSPFPTPVIVHGASQTFRDKRPTAGSDRSQQSFSETPYPCPSLLSDSLCTADNNSRRRALRFCRFRGSRWLRPTHGLFRCRKYTLPTLHKAVERRPNPDNRPKAACH